MWTFYIDFLLIVLFIIILLYYYLRYHYNYWNHQNVPQTDCVSKFMGNLSSILRMKSSSAQFIKDIYQHRAAIDQPIMGIYLFYKPALIIRDPSLIKRILVKDFSKFSDRFSNSDYDRDPLGCRNLFFLNNPIWKEMRFKLTPFFTGGKLKQMFVLIDEIGRNLNDYLMKKPLNQYGSFQLELKELCTLYTIDVIATIAFGIQANSFTNPHSEFHHHGREIFRFSTRRALDFSIVFFLPHLAPYFGIKVVPNEQSEFLRSTINYVIKEREKSGKIRNDLIDILIELKNWSKIHFKSSEAKKNLIFDEDLLVAQAAIFFTAGFEPTSAAMSFALYEMARNPHVQEKIREEIRLNLIANGGELRQRDIDNLTYMQMVIDETLRMYPPLPFLDRHCKLSQKKQTYSLHPFHNYSIPNGMPVYIPLYAIHMDPKYYPNPTEFRPERFAIERKKNLLPFTYMPFGSGPRCCIGERFAMIQTKIGLYHFLRNHRVIANGKLLPLKFNTKALILQSEHGIHLNIERDPLIIHKSL